MEEPKKKASSAIAEGLGNTLAGFTKAIDNYEEEIQKEEGPQEAKSGKEALFGDREQKIKAAAEADMEEFEEMIDEGKDLPENPNPLLLSNEDFEKSIWKIQVEKNGNWFSGNYVPGELKIAFASNDDGIVEYAGDPFTKGKWFTDSGSVYFERRPLGALGPLSPGQEYFRGSLQGWATDDLELQTAGYVSGYSPLFPTAILGRFLMTREKKISQTELEDRLAYSRKELGLDKSAELEAAAPKKTLDLSEDLTDEEERRKLAAEWMPSTLLDENAKDQKQDQMTKSLERLKETVVETGSKYMDEDMWKD